MLLYFVFALQAPRDITAIHSAAKDPKQYSRRIASQCGLIDLRRARLPKGDEELRLWDYGWTVETVILRRRAGAWSAVRVSAQWTQLSGSKRYRLVPTPPENVSAPPEGWPKFWKRVETLRAWTLPDQSQLPPIRRGLVATDAHIVTDGHAIEVETQRNGIYRAYFYTNPDIGKQGPNSDRIVALDRLLLSKFPLPASRK